MFNLHLDAKQLKDGADNLVQQYPNDLEPSLAEELVHFPDISRERIHLIRDMCLMTRMKP